MAIREGFLKEAVPGAFVGLAAGLIAGGLAALVGQPLGWALVTTVALGLPLGAFGGGFSLLVAAGRLPAGRFAPVALYWLVAFPVARLVHEITVSLVLAGQVRLPPDLAGFLAYQGIVSLGWAIGFLWLHERIAMRLRLRHRLRATASR
ncbi:hypothetical protein [Lentzea albidocapillata]|uniref:Uncharacterized protein n=1 Tax=Lentzea albidocapillata TaxID=40571 RepID=A0A1W2D302_9PSEU|nr:hypothetical protein [Lentzea albidocapillata]SMC91424.1 hypothetical protein SAMN05660733_02647 [Lentzea albidocapillata]